MDIHGGRSSMPSRSANGQRRRKTEPWPLGRRSAGRRKEQLHCNAGRAAFTLSRADQGAEQRYGGGRGGVDQTPSETAGDLAPLADLGSRVGDGQAQGVYGSHECAGLLLRSTKPLATWNARKYQSAPATIPTTRNRPVRHLSRAARPGRAALEPTPKKNPRIPNSGE